MLGSKPVNTPMGPNFNLLVISGEIVELEYPWEVQMSVGKLNYLTMTRLDISFATSVTSQFMEKPCSG